MVDLREEGHTQEDTRQSVLPNTAGDNTCVQHYAGVGLRIPLDLVHSQTTVEAGAGRIVLRQYSAGKWPDAASGQASILEQKDLQAELKRGS